MLVCYSWEPQGKDFIIFSVVQNIHEDPGLLAVNSTILSLGAVMSVSTIFS
jgi:hypothetical protein